MPTTFPEALFVVGGGAPCRPVLGCFGSVGRGRSVRNQREDVFVALSFVDQSSQGWLRHVCIRSYASVRPGVNMHMDAPIAR